MWTPDACRVLRPGFRVVWASPRESTKSLAALILALQIIEAAERWCISTSRTGRRAKGRRCKSSSRLAARKLSLSCRSPALLSAPSTRRRSRSTAGSATLTIIDSAARALGRLGLRENEASDITRNSEGVVDPIREQDSAVLTLDNTPHEADRYTGSTPKEDQVDARLRREGERCEHQDSRHDHPDTHTNARRGRGRAAPMWRGGGIYTRLITGSEWKDNELELALSLYLISDPGQTVEAIA